MEFKKGLLSFTQLIIGALKTANQAFGSVLALYIFVGCLMGLLVAITVGVFFIFSIHPVVWFPFYIVACLLAAVIGITVSLAVVQLLAAAIEKNGIGIVDSFTSSIVPSVYLIVSSLIFSIPAGLLMAGVYFTHSAIAMILMALALNILAIPFIFVPQALALRGEGPISAILYSWDLFRRHYIKIIATLFSLWVLGGLIVLAIFCALKAFATPQLLMLLMDPNMLPALIMSKQVSYPIVIAGGLVCAFLQLYAVLTIQALITLLFLNLDYCHRPVSDIEDIEAVSEEIISTELLPNVSIKQASVKTQTDENTDHHLEQVYTEEEHLAKAVNAVEDRMPTLYFDKTITQRLDETERQILERQSKQNLKPTDEDNSPIKMSDNTL